MAVKRIKLIFSLLLTGGYMVAALAGVSEGVTAYKAGDYATALREFKKAAATNDPVAQGNLGWMYEHGDGVEADPEQALNWYNQAAENGGDPNLKKRQELMLIVLQKKMNGHKEDPNSLASIHRSQKNDSGNTSQAFGAKLRACIRPGVVYNTEPRSFNDKNPQVDYRIKLNSDGTISTLELIKSSGRADFDKAVETGIRACRVFPSPPNGKYPTYIDISYRMWD